jgi:hypothetical protein
VAGNHDFSLNTVPAALFLVSLVVPSVASLGRGLIASWLLFGLWAVVALVERPAGLRVLLAEISRRRIELSLLGCWVTVLVSNWALGRGYSGEIHLQRMATFLMLVTIDVVRSSRRESGRWLLILFSLVLGVELLRSLPVLWSQPGLPRNVMLRSEGLAGAALAGVGEYGFYTSCAILSPFLLGKAFSEKGAGRYVLLLALFASGIAVALATFLGAGLLMLVGFFLTGAVGLRGRGRGRTLAIFASTATAAFVLWNFALKESEQSEYVVEKFDSEVRGVSDRGLVEGDQTMRGELWSNSMETMLANPLFGVGAGTFSANPLYGYTVGGHSSLVDLPAEYGIPAVICFLAFWGLAMKRTLRASRRSEARLAATGKMVACLLFTVAGTYNPVIMIPAIEAVVFGLVMGEPDRET